jgi:hypothetical protein
MLIATLLAFHLCFDLQANIVGEWELLNITDNSISLYTIEFHIDNKRAIIGSAWAPPSRESKRRFLEVIFEVVFSGVNKGDILRLTPERSYFTHFDCLGIEEDENLIVSKGHFSATESYTITFLNQTYGNLTVTGRGAMLFKRNPPKAPGMSAKTKKFWQLLGAGGMVVLSNMTIRWCSRNDALKEQLKRERDEMMEQLSRVRVVKRKKEDGEGGGSEEGQEKPEDE